MIYYIHLQAFILKLKAPLYGYHFSSYPHLRAASCFFLTSSQDNVQPPPRLIPWLPLCKQNSVSSLHVAAGFGCVQRGRPAATEGTEDRCGLHNDQQISYLSAPNPASIPPYISLRLLRQAMPSLLCCAEPESPRQVAPSHYWLERANQWTQQGELLQLHWKAIINIFQ